jgi:hypothetical protein
VPVAFLGWGGDSCGDHIEVSPNQRCACFGHGVRLRGGARSEGEQLLWFASIWHVEGALCVVERVRQALARHRFCRRGQASWSSLSAQFPRCPRAKKNGALGSTNVCQDIGNETPPFKAVSRLGACNRASKVSLHDAERLGGVSCSARCATALMGSPMVS